MKRKMHLHPDLNRVDVCKTWSKLFLVHVVHAWPSIFFFFLCFVQHIIVLILVMESSRHARLYLFRSSAFNLILVGSFREFILMMMKSSLWCLLHLHLLWLSFPSNEGDHDYNANLEPHVYLLLSLSRNEFFLDFLTHESWQVSSLKSRHGFLFGDDDSLFVWFLSLSLTHLEVLLCR